AFAPGPDWLHVRAANAQPAGRLQPAEEARPGFYWGIRRVEAAAAAAGAHSGTVRGTIQKALARPPGDAFGGWHAARHARVGGLRWEIRHCEFVQGTPERYLNVEAAESGD